MDDDQVQRAVDAGQAHVVGELPDSPVALDGEYWAREGDVWSPVTSDETIAFLRDADRRMGLADQAVRDAESS